MHVGISGTDGRVAKGVMEWLCSSTVLLLNSHIAQCNTLFDSTAVAALTFMVCV